MQTGLKRVFTLDKWGAPGRFDPCRGHIAFPLLLAFLLVGGGFYVFGYAVVSGGLRWFPAPYVVEMHGRF